ncbi:MAG: GTP pyrophosphokinase family protein [Spirochaetaceae bacterium]|nr:MAG: GTP pyrophosphokinase family protein [Spirochaetaceae bacterium]
MSDEAQLPVAVERMNTDRQSVRRFLIRYEFALKTIQTRIEILKSEFEAVHEYNPIEHINHRLKTPESIQRKAHRRGCDMTFEAIEKHIRDIAGLRVTCSFVADIYRVASMLVQQPDIEVELYKDYIEEPKPSGYRSLHLILLVPVYLSNCVVRMPVEVQLRTIAMDFWASLEHKIYYKYRRDVPQRLRDGLLDAARDIERLDQKMEAIHREMRDLKIADETADPL